MTFWSSFVQGSSFRRQLSLVVALGIFSLALISSTLLSWQSKQRLQENFVLQGLRVATSLGQQSRLSLLLMAPDNATEAVNAALAFPDIVSVEIRTQDGLKLLSRGSLSDTAIPARVALTAERGTSAYLEGEDDKAWALVAPVTQEEPGMDSPFEMQDRKIQLLGYVRVVQSKATLQKMSRDVFLVNLVISLAFAAVMVLLIRRLARHLTRPLESLAQTMGRAERGETVEPAALSGPRDIVEMAHAFNSMMQVLQEREHELRQSRDDAVRYARLKAEFAATISHEIRTPLNGVIGSLDMLKNGALPPRQSQLVRLAWDSSRFLMELINNILDFSRLEAGKIEPERIDFNLQELLAGVVEIVSPEARHKNLSLVWTIFPPLAENFCGDPGRMRQVLINLVANAIKFTDQGAVSISARNAGEGRVRIEVSDTGIGIAPESQEHIFDSFTQADSSTTRRFGGSGLGLAICKKLIQLLGGEIGVDSKPGVGSLFWFELPLGEATAPVALHDVVLPAGQGSGNCCILVVEDNRTNQIIATRMLEMLGVQVGIAANGLEAVGAYRRDNWDMVLMDCNMPEMDGFEATASIRSIEADGGTRIPIVAMTADTQPTNVSKCLAAGMDDHLAKPLTLDALTAVLRRWLAWQPRHLVLEDEEAGNDGPLSRQTLGHLREALGDDIDKAINPFLEDMPRYLEDISQGLAEGDAETLRRTAHTIKGAAGNVGAASLANVARMLEERAGQDNLQDAGRLVDRLHAEYAQVEPLLRAEVEGTGNPAARVASQEHPLIMIVDDDRSTRSSLKAALTHAEFRVEEAGHGAEALALLECCTPDVILMDAMMPVMDGFTACAAIKQSPLWKSIPVLMITALEDRISIERAFAAGASDYIPKPLHFSVVNQRVRRVVEVSRAERHVQHLAFNDILTGLPNRLMFTNQMTLAVDRASAHKTQFGVLFLDLDRFKFINDTLGHDVGDHLLQAVAARIKNCVRNGDCVARQGGDEFTILLNELPEPASAAAVAQKICASFAQPFEISNHEIFVNASIGISLFPDDGQDVSSLLRHADTAMYRAKRSSSRVCFYEPNMEQAISGHIKLEGDLRHALERDELLVYYQPVSRAGDGVVIGMEALVRWQHPTRGLVSPVEFIPMAEETGLIVPLGEHVLNLACRQVKAWRDQENPDLYVAVNLSARQLEQAADVVVMVQNALAGSGLPPSALILEITESVLMEHARETIVTLHQLRSLGVRLAIDDFGTGYSSLGYLKRFPTDTLKIDKSFVQDMIHDQDAASIVTGIIALAHSLRLKVVAEGVETAEQRDALAALGCDYLQGYLLSQPLPAAEFEVRMLPLTRVA